MKILLLSTLLVFCQISVFSQKPTASPTSSLDLKAIPFPCQVLDNPQEIKVLSPNSLLLTAAAGTDLHNPASGAFRKSNAPKFLFTPTDSSFEFSAKITPSHDNLYDGGALLLWTDTGNWAKVLLQNTGDNSVLGLSVVRNKETDDSYFPVGNAREIYLKVTKKGKVCSFSTSPDGKAWTVLRQFVYHLPAGWHIGFYAQSPKGPACQTIFSDIRYLPLK